MIAPGSKVPNKRGPSKIGSSSARGLDLETEWSTTIVSLEKLLVLSWKPVGESKSQPLKNAYVVVEPLGPCVSAMRQKLDRKAFIPLIERPLFVGRTNEEGVFHALPRDGAGTAVDMSSITTPLFVVGTSMKIWWTHERKVFDDVTSLDVIGTPDCPLNWMHPVELVFDDKYDLPSTIEHALHYLDNGPDVREVLVANREERFPTEIVRPADDGTWHVELHDQHLELAVDCAVSPLQAASSSPPRAVSERGAHEPCDPAAVRPVRAA